MTKVHALKFPQLHLRQTWDLKAFKTHRSLWPKKLKMFEANNRGVFLHSPTSDRSWITKGSGCLTSQWMGSGVVGRSWKVRKKRVLPKQHLKHGCWKLVKLMKLFADKLMKTCFWSFPSFCDEVPFPLTKVSTRHMQHCRRFVGQIQVLYRRNEISINVWNGIWYHHE